MATSLPRISRIWSMDRVVSSRPFRRMLPVTMWPDGGSRRMIDMPVMDFPHPDSPTRPTVSPGSMVRETPSTACTVECRIRMCVRRSSTSSRLTTWVSESTRDVAFGSRGLRDSTCACLERGHSAQ